MFDVLGQGLYKEVTPAVFGNQALGITPGGPQDIFSYRCGNTMLSNELDSPALEIIHLPGIVFHHTTFFILTGAPRKAFLDEKPIKHGVVYRAEANTKLEFSKTHYGFRTYFCYRRAPAKGIESRERGSFNDIAHWQDSFGRIRIIEGPEYKYLENPDDFFKYPWRVTKKMSSMGMRLARPEIELNYKHKVSMVSEAVADGTIQLTPKGPLVLMRHRQTVGGYPRIFNVISADVDMLAQHGPGTLIRFQKVTMADALQALQQQKKDLESLSQALQ